MQLAKQLTAKNHHQFFFQLENRQYSDSLSIYGLKSSFKTVFIAVLYKYFIKEYCPNLSYYADLSGQYIPFNTAQKLKFSIKDFFSKCDQIRRFLPILSHLLKNP